LRDSALSKVDARTRLCPAIMVGIHLGTSAFLNVRACVEFADPADARKDQTDRWYPS
jgi:hypothetical protein